MSAENVELEEQLTLFENEDENNEVEAGEELTGGESDVGNELERAVYEQMQKIHNSGLVVGFQTACHTALDKIYAFERKAGKKSMNDYKRLIKDLKRFFEIGVSRKVSEAVNDESEEDAEIETVQN